MSKEGAAKSEQHEDGFFFYHKGVVCHKYSSPGQTINKEYYIKVLCWLRYAVRTKWPQLWASGDWQLHHDNAPAHSSQLLQGFLAKHRIIQVRQLPYSPYLAPCNFWLFPKLKLPLKGRFQTVEDIKENATRQLMAIPKEDFEDCFENWKGHWDKCVILQGQYTKGDQGTIVLHRLLFF
jgi:hypothetical protein